MPREVFLSHSQKDVERVTAACGALERAGITCWIAPRDVLPSQTWSGAIVDAIGACRVVVVALSANANASNEVLREIELAAKQGKPIVSWRIENVTPSGPLAYFLSATQWQDGFGGAFELRLDELTQTLRVLLDRPATPAPASTPAPGAAREDFELDHLTASSHGRVGSLLDRLFKDR
jgi:hypothetical protein